MTVFNIRFVYYEFIFSSDTLGKMSCIIYLCGVLKTKEYGNRD